MIRWSGMAAEPPPKSWELYLMQVVPEDLDINDCIHLHTYPPKHR